MKTKTQTKTKTPKTPKTARVPSVVRTDVDAIRVDAAAARKKLAEVVEILDRIEGRGQLAADELR
jgi:hypothetical protein